MWQHGDLVTIGKVLAELGYIYREADRGKMTWADAGQATRILREVRHCLEATDIERRLAALAQAAVADPDWLRPEGAGRYASTH